MMWSLKQRAVGSKPGADLRFSKFIVQNRFVIVISPLEHSPLDADLPINLELPRLEPAAYFYAIYLD